MYVFKGRNLIKFLPLLFIFILFYLPLLNIIIKGVDLLFFKSILSSFYYKKIISFTIYQALLSSTLSVLIAIPGAYLLARYDFFGKKLFLSISSLPFILPSILTVLGFVLLFGNKGVLNSLLMNIFNLKTPPLKILYSIYAVLLAHIFYNFPLAIRIITSRWQKMPRELTEASYSLGYGKIKTFFNITLPYLKTSIYTSFTLIFLYCFMSFGIILVLGGGPSLSTIEVEVYRFARISLNIPKAATLSIIESLFTIIILFLYLRNEKKEPEFIDGATYTKKLNKVSATFFSLYLIPLCLILIAPLLTILINSFFKKIGYTDTKILTLDWYKSIFGLLNNKFNITALLAIKNSLLLGVSSVTLTLPISLLITYTINQKFKFKSFYIAMFFLPMGISSIIIGLSYLNLNITGSFFYIVLAHTFISMPLSIRALNNSYKTIDKSLIDASMALGSNRYQTFLKIELPIMKSGIITASIFTFAISVGEMNASIMLAPTGFITIPLAIYQLIGNYNFYGACALGSILLIICLLSFRLIEKVEI